MPPPQPGFEPRWTPGQNSASTSDSWTSSKSHRLTTPSHPALLCFILSFFLRSPSRCCFLLSVFLFTGRLNHRRSCNLPPRSEHLAHHLDENTLGLKKLLRSVIYCLFDLDPCIFFILGFEIEIYSWFLFPFCFVDG